MTKTAEITEVNCWLRLYGWVKADIEGVYQNVHRAKKISSILNMFKDVGSGPGVYQNVRRW